MAEPPLVSIVTPAFNRARLIEATIESVLAQDYPNLECIVVDGGSTDGTLEILKRYEGRLAWISEPGRGRADAVNTGFRRAGGGIVAWLNPGDTYRPGAVKAAVGHLVAHPEVAVVYGDGDLVDEDGRVTRRSPSSRPFDLWTLVYVGDYVLPQAAFFRRRTLEAVGYLDPALSWAADWDLFIRIGKRFRIDYLPVDMANVREDPAATTSPGGVTRFRELCGVVRRHGRRRYPRAVLTHGIDTYLRLVFDALARMLPGRLAPALAWTQRTVERVLSGAVRRLLGEPQGVFGDGGVSGRARFLLPAGAAARTVRLRGTRAGLPSRERPLRIAATANGVALPAANVEGAGEFDVVWSLPPALAGAAVLEVELRSRPACASSRVPLVGDRRRVAFRLASIAAG